MIVKQLQPEIMSCDIRFSIMTKSKNNNDPDYKRYVLWQFFQRSNHVAKTVWNDKNMLTFMHSSLESKWQLQWASIFLCMTLTHNPERFSTVVKHFVMMTLRSARFLLLPVTVATVGGCSAWAQLHTALATSIMLTLRWQPFPPLLMLLPHL